MLDNQLRSFEIRTLLIQVPHSPVDCSIVDDRLVNFAKYFRIDVGPGPWQSSADELRELQSVHDRILYPLYLQSAAGDRKNQNQGLLHLENHTIYCSLCVWILVRVENLRNLVQRIHAGLRWLPHHQQVARVCIQIHFLEHQHAIVLNSSL